MIFDQLKDRDSDLVQRGLARGCPVCNVDAGVPCNTVSTPNRPLFEAFNHWVHMIRSDGIKYTMKDEGMKG